MTEEYSSDAVANYIKVQDQRFNIISIGAIILIILITIGGVLLTLK
jgi:hypothetical protein